MFWFKRLVHVNGFDLCPDGYLSLSPTGKDRRKRVSDEDFTVFDDEATDSDDEATDFGAGRPKMDFVYALSVIASHDAQLAMVCMHFSMKAGFFNRKFPVQSSVLACVCKDLNTAFGYKGTFDGCQICLRAAQWMKREIIAEGGEKISFFNLDTEGWKRELRLAGDVCRFSLQSYPRESFTVECDFCGLRHTCNHCHVTYEQSDEKIVEEELGLLNSHYTGYLCAGCLTCTEHSLEIPDRIAAIDKRLSKFEDLCHAIIFVDPETETESRTDTNTDTNTDTDLV